MSTFFLGNVPLSRGYRRSQRQLQPLAPRKESDRPRERPTFALLLFSRWDDYIQSFLAEIGWLAELAPVQDFNSFSIMFYYIISSIYQIIGDLFGPISIFGLFHSVIGSFANIWEFSGCLLLCNTMLLSHTNSKKFPLSCPKLVAFLPFFLEPRWHGLKSWV